MVGLGVSPSRINAVIRKTRRFVINTPVRPAVLDPDLAFTPPEIAAHDLEADALTMLEAEYALSRCFDSLDVISAALKLGRRTFEQRRIALDGEECPCRVCQFNRKRGYFPQKLVTDER